MDEATDCRFEWSSNVGEYAFAWAGSGLVAWTIVWQLSCGSELAAFAGCQVGIFEVCREATRDTRLHGGLNAFAAGVQARVPEASCFLTRKMFHMVGALPGVEGGIHGGRVDKSSGCGCCRRCDRDGGKNVDGVFPVVW